MGNNYCIHCGTPLNYYINNKHASRKSCRFSHDKIHNFQSKSFIMLSSCSNKIKNGVKDCLKKQMKKTKNRDVNIEMCHF